MKTTGRDGFRHLTADQLALLTLNGLEGLEGALHHFQTWIQLYCPVQHVRSGKEVSAKVAFLLCWLTDRNLQPAEDTL